MHSYDGALALIRTGRNTDWSSLDQARLPVDLWVNEGYYAEEMGHFSN